LIREIAWPCIETAITTGATGLAATLEATVTATGAAIAFFGVGMVGAVTGGILIDIQKTPSRKQKDRLSDHNLSQDGSFNLHDSIGI